MTRRGTVVVVAYYAPPAVGIAANRLRGMVRHLAEAGWDAVVVAPETVHHHVDEDADLVGARVVRAPNPEPSRWLRRLAGRGEGEPGDAPSDGGVRTLRPVETGAAGGLLRRLVRRWLYIPDAQALWIGPAARAAAAEVERAPGPVVLYSSSVPYSAHFAARKAARRTGVPWVAEYRDPWSAAPPQLGRRPALRQWVDRRLDRAVVTGASRVVVTTEATRDLFLRTFAELEEDGVAVVRNGWEERVPDAAPGPGEPLMLLYSGTLLSWEWAVPLLEALARVAGDPSEPAVRLRVLGPQEPWRRAAREVGLDPGLLDLPGLVPAGEVPARLARASALVVLQPDPELGLYVAGKAYEYLGSRRPVLAWVPGGGEMAALLRDHGDLRHVPHDAPGAFLPALQGLLADHRAGELQGARVPREAVEPLSRRAQARRVARVLDELVSDRPSSPAPR